MRRMHNGAVIAAPLYVLPYSCNHYSYRVVLSIKIYSVLYILKDILAVTFIIRVRTAATSLRLILAFGLQLRAASTPRSICRRLIYLSMVCQW